MDDVLKCRLKVEFFTQFITYTVFLISGKLGSGYTVTTWQCHHYMVRSYIIQKINIYRKSFSFEVLSNKR